MNVKPLYKEKNMKKLRRTPDTQAFEDVKSLIAKATREIKSAHLEIEVEKQEIKDEIGELLALLEDFPD